MCSVLELFVKSGVRATNQLFSVDSNGKDTMTTTHTIKNVNIVDAAFTLYPLDLIMSFSHMALNSQGLCLRHRTEASKKLV
jgi:hypothetical protein